MSQPRRGHEYPLPAEIPTAADVVRNPLVTAIVEAYDDYDAYNEGIEQGAESPQKRQSATKR